MFFRRFLVAATIVVLAVGSAYATSPAVNSDQDNWFHTAFLNGVDSEGVVRGFTAHLDLIPSLDPYNPPSVVFQNEAGDTVEATVEFQTEFLSGGDMRRLRRLTLRVSASEEYVFERTVSFIGKREEGAGLLVYSVNVEDNWQERSRVLEVSWMNDIRSIDPWVRMQFKEVELQLVSLVAIGELQTLLNEVRSGPVEYNELPPLYELTGGIFDTGRLPERSDFSLVVETIDPRPEPGTGNRHLYPLDRNSTINKNIGCSTGLVRVFRYYEYTWGPYHRTQVVSVHMRLATLIELDFRFAAEEIMRKDIDLYPAQPSFYSMSDAYCPRGDIILELALAVVQSGLDRQNE